MRLTHAVLLAPSVLLVAAVAQAQVAGSLRGSVYDREFESPVPDAVVTIVETGARVVADDQGNFVFPQVAPGTYTVVFTKAGYGRQVKSGVVVAEGQLVDVEVQMAGEIEEMEEFLVQELALSGTEAALLNLRLDSPALLDAVSAEFISRAGASDAAAALQLVSGATVQDGKYAVVRGLPDRYVSSQLNGVRLPTADEEKRAVQLDQFPSAVIESVQVSKTFTPDQQGDASGGAVNVILKGIPEQNGIQFRSQVGYNSQAGGRDDFLSSKGGGVNFWGIDDGRRDIQYDNIGENWTGPVGTSATDSPLDYKWSLSGGGKYDVDEDVKVGGFASFFYERDSSYFDNGINDSLWVERPGDPMTPQTYQGTPVDGDFKTKLLDITQGSESVQWGALGTVGVETPQHKLGFTYLYTRATDDTSTLATNTRGKAYYFPGYDPNDPQGPGNSPSEVLASPYLRLETLDYIERSTSTYILNGKHKLGVPPEPLTEYMGWEVEETGEGAGWGIPEIDWTAAIGGAYFDEPDKTQFGALWIPDSFNPGLPEFGIPSFTTPAVWQPFKPDANFTLGNQQRIWKEIEEENVQLALNFKQPFKLDAEREGSFKIGIFDDTLDRQFNQDTFSNFNDNSTWEGAWDTPWSAVVPFQNHPISDGPPFVDVDYTGDQKIFAMYLMADYDLSKDLKVIGGARYETTDLSIVNSPEIDATWFPDGATAPVALNPGDSDVYYDRQDLLPAIAFEWEAQDDLVFRVAYTQTVARQTFRELTPIIQQEFLGGPIFIGNPDLDMSELRNYDFRVDYTGMKGAFLSGSVFYKQVNGPIEYVQRIASFEYTTPENYPDGTILGLELEARQDFGEIREDLKGLTLGANATFIDSVVQLPEDEIAALSEPFINAPQSERAMTATPAYLLNLFATYDIEETGTQLSLFYTMTGDTLVAGAGATGSNYVPDIYALPYDSLNFTVTQKLDHGFSLFFQAKNITNPEIQTVYRSRYIGGDVLNTSFTAGVDFAIGLAWRVEF